MTKPSVELLKKIVSLKKGGEVREQQQTAVDAIEHAILHDENLLLEAPTGSGKALAVETPILTSKGWSTMGELQAGDKVYGTSGKLVTVTKVHNVFKGNKVYDVLFSNGETITADSDHLWQVNPFAAELKIEVKEVNKSRLEELKTKAITLYSSDGNTLISEIEGLSSYPDEIIRIVAHFSTVIDENTDVIVLEPMNFLENLYIEMLGRSSTWKTEEIAQLYNGEESELYKRFTINRNLPLEFTAQADELLPVSAEYFGDWIAGNNSVFNETEVRCLAALGVTQSDHIPEVYLNSSIPSRKKLLLAIFNKAEQGIFQSTSSTLIDEIQFLASSLGRVTETALNVLPDSVTYAIKLEPEENISESIISLTLTDSSEVRCITVDADDHLFLAGKTLIPTHNTLSYLIPVIENESKVVISTATKQLSEQAMKDIDFMNDSLKKLKSHKRADAALLKGRDNYLCLAKSEDMQRLEDKANTLFTVGEAKNDISAAANKIATEAGQIADWADETQTGDRTEAPPVSDETWRQYSSTNAECPGKQACPFGQECFAELARDKARAANIVITNHAIVAIDLNTEGQLLGDRDVFIFDELHELDNYVSSAWGAELTYRKLDTTYKLLKSIPSIDEKDVAALKELLDTYDAALKTVEKGLIDNEDSSLKLENFIMRLYNVMTNIMSKVARAEKEASTDALKRIYTNAKKVAGELRDVAETLSHTDFETVRWTVDSAEYEKWKPKKAPAKRGAAKSAIPTNSGSTMSLHAAPLRIGPKLQDKLTEREAIMIGLSATVTVMGRTDIPVHNFGLDKKPHNVVVLDSPFDYKKQAMLYIPDGDFPLPVGATRKDHAEAMKKDSASLIKAAGGRSLILSTSSDGVTEYAEYYRKHLKGMKFLAQGEAPNSQLIDTFKEEHASSLIGTMGFWHGLDAPGSTLILDVIDKLPFPKPNDPLLLARKNYADRQGRNGFMEIMVTVADWMVRQGLGRAIRSKSDKAIIAIYDTRLVDKNYGRAIIANFHGIGLFRDHAKVEAALKRLAAMSAEEEAKQ